MFNSLLDEGRLAIDTNHLERQLRPLAQGGANWLFLGRESAGATAATLYTVRGHRRLRTAGLPVQFPPHSLRVATVTDLLTQDFSLKTCSIWPAMLIPEPRGCTTVARK